VREEGADNDAERDIVLGRNGVAFDLVAHAGHPVETCRIGKGEVRELVQVVNQHVVA
jgi:hypothetical protein